MITCISGKVHFLSADDAQKELRKIKNYKKNKWLRKCECAVYFCKLCSMWHLTSKKQAAQDELHKIKGKSR